ncbi:MAG: GDSL family lipase [Lachnospiraceae bacterium]|nr:GDSL family lipase [Lachnospiraceae bacterium]
MEELRTWLPEEIKELRVLGRTAKKHPLPLFWTGSGFECNYDGTELWCEFETDYSYYEQWIAVYVNGAFLSRQMLNKGKQKVCLYRNMATRKVNHVKVIKEVQAMSEDPDTYLVIHGLCGDGEFYPLPEPDCRIEFIGDSITSGEGSYGSTVEQDWISMWFSASRTYPYLVAERFGAEYRVLSQSGFGVYCAYDNNPDRTIPRYYEQVCGTLTGEHNRLLGAKELHDFSSWQPDYIVINLGTNDGGAFHNPEWIDADTGRKNKMEYDKNGQPMKESLDKVQTAVTEFLSLVRKNNPKAHILWAYGMMGTLVEPAITEGIREFCTASGDTKVHYIRLEEIENDGIGARSHPGEKGHRQAAEVLGNYIETLQRQEKE